MWLAHLAGGAIGGAACVTAAWAVLTPLRALLSVEVRAGAVGVLLVLFAVQDARRRPLSSGRRQVPVRWRSKYGPYLGYAMYGAVLGAGVLTFAPYAVTYLVYAVAALLGGAAEAAVAGALLGAGRTLLMGPISLYPTVERLQYTLAGAYRVAPILSAALSVALLVDLGWHAADRLGA